MFADGGPIDTVRDPMIMGRGLISHGIVRMCGSEITRVRTSDDLVATAKRIAPDDPSVRLRFAARAWAWVKSIRH